MSVIKFKKLFKFQLTSSLFYASYFRLKHGNFAFINRYPGLIKYKHLERVRRRISKQFKRLELKRFRVYLTIKMWRFYTKKPHLSRMGKGSGGISHWLVFLKMNSIFIELCSYKPFQLVFKIGYRSVLAFPLKSRMITRALLD